MENVFVVLFSVRGRMFLNVARKKVSENYSIRPTKSVHLENFSTLLVVRPASMHNFMAQLSKLEIR